MRKVLIIFLIIFTNLEAADFKLRIGKNFDSPWSLTFVDNENLIISEKPGNLKLVNLREKSIKKLRHN